ncbi:MAG TPA: METTL5 family protein [Candidatus Bathyarchaeia archaeon]|nr:METTL5 family protein [Candidatus Bathyarchaeia archaeon]
MQKRLVRKLDLERFLQQIEPHPSPKPSLEQYMTPTDVAAAMLYIAAYVNDDIVGKSVLDLGCGTGKLALGAAFLSAKQVVGVDVDKVAVEMAFENAVKTGLKRKVQWVAADVSVVHGKFDTVLQNPPFGVQKRNADRVFLEKALETGKVVYSLHKKTFLAKSRVDKTFLENFIEGHGGEIQTVYPMVMSIPHMFSFHTKRKHEFAVDLYVIKRKC